MNYRWLAVAGWTACALLVGGVISVRQVEGQVEPPPAPAPEAGMVPVGGVLLWWGTDDEIPDGFEVCDGRVPKLRDASLKTKKPDLRGRVPIGVENVNAFRPWSDTTGSLAQAGQAIVAHTHPISATVQTETLLNAANKPVVITYLQPAPSGKGDLVTGTPSVAPDVEVPHGKDDLGTATTGFLFIVRVK